jgi:type I restriction enzyme M protein
MRRKLIEADVIECILGLGPNLFYNSPMEACVVVCRTSKPKPRRGKILFINAVNEVTRERAQSFLTNDHLDRIAKAYEQFKNEPNFTRIASLEEIRAKDGNLSIPLYVTSSSPVMEVCEASATYDSDRLTEALTTWMESSRQVRKALDSILEAQR